MQQTHREPVERTNVRTKSANCEPVLTKVFSPSHRSSHGHAVIFSSSLLTGISRWEVLRAKRNRLNNSAAVSRNSKPGDTHWQCRWVASGSSMRLRSSREHYGAVLKGLTMRQVRVRGASSVALRIFLEILLGRTRET